MREILICSPSVAFAFGISASQFEGACGSSGPSQGARPPAERGRSLLRWHACCDHRRQSTLDRWWFVRGALLPSELCRLACLIRQHMCTLFVKRQAIHPPTQAGAFWPPSCKRILSQHRPIRQCSCSPCQVAGSASCTGRAARSIAQMCRPAGKPVSSATTRKPKCS